MKSDIGKAKFIQRHGNTWEQGFAKSIQKLLEEDKFITPKQQYWWAKMKRKYHINNKKRKEHIDFSPIIFKDERKEKIQREAYNKWVEAGFNGTIEAATGIGKTMIGLMAIQQENLNVIVVVPKIDLQEQWEDEIKNVLKIDYGIGKVGGGHHDFDKRILICVVNSLRDVDDLKADLLIMDEMHRYGSEENFKFLETGKFKKILGLTATTKRQDGAESNLFKHAPLVYQYSQGEAITEGLLSEFEMINVGVDLTHLEGVEYRKVCGYISQNFSTFSNNFNKVQQAVRTRMGVISSIACGLMGAFSRRKSLLSNAENKTKKAIDLAVKEVDDGSKILIFCEYIKTAELIKRQIQNMYIKTGIYHSRMKSDKKEEMLKDFKEGKCNVMIAVKSLDEGTNVVDCNCAIIVAGSSVKRQQVQRLGRILRVSEGKRIAKVYQLYVKDTKDLDWLKLRNKELNKNAKTMRWI